MAQSQWASQGFERTGFSDWIDYNRNTDVIRYGSYDINPELLGLKRNRSKIDPSKIKSLDDVFRQLGADQQSIDRYNQPQWNMWGTTTNRDVFTGKDAWKNDVATQMWEMVRPRTKQEMLWGIGKPQTSFDSRDPRYNSQVAALKQQNSPFGSINTGTISGGQMGMAGIGIQPKPTTYHKIFKGEDGMLNFEFGDLIPDTQDFAQKVANMTYQLYGQGYNSRYGKNPSGVGKTPDGLGTPKSTNNGGGKSPTLIGG